MSYLQFAIWSIVNARKCGRSPMVSAIETVEAGVYSTTDAIDFVTHPTTAIGRLRDPDPALVRFVRSNIDRLAQPQEDRYQNQGDHRAFDVFENIFQDVHIDFLRSLGNYMSPGDAFGNALMLDPPLLGWWH